MEGESSTTRVSQLCLKRGPNASWWQLWEKSQQLIAAIVGALASGNSVAECARRVLGAACLICLPTAVLCLYFCPSRQSAVGSLVELVLENTLQNILIEASRGEVVLTARPMVIAVPTAPSPR